MLIKLPKFSPFSPVHPSWHFYALLFGIISGIVASFLLNFSLFSGWIWLVFSGLLLICALKSLWRCLIPFAFLAGFMIGSCRSAPIFEANQSFARLVNQTVTISGTVSEDPDLSSGRAVLRLTNLKIHSRDAPSSESPPLSLPGTLYVKLSSAPELARSDALTLKGKLGAGFGTFVGILTRPEILSIEKPLIADPLAQFKTGFAAAVAAQLSPPAANLGMSYLLGMKSGLSDEFSEQLRAVGMTHVVVASGAHLAILVGATRKIFGKISRFAGTMFGIIAILFFALTVGFTPSMTRAALVAILTLTFAYVGRTFTPLRLISLVAAVTLLIEPSHFLNLGWQLSFASFFGILILAPRLTRFLYGGKPAPWLASMFITSLSTSLICAPILIYNFSSISLLSFVANFIILPTLPYAMLLVFLTGLMSAFTPVVALIAKLTELLLGLHIWLIQYLSEKSIFILTFENVDLRIFLLYLPILATLVLPKFLSKRRISLELASAAPP